MAVDAAGLTQAAPLDHAAVRRIVIGILLAMFLAALDQTIVATALPTIGRELGDLEHLPWVVTAYLLSSDRGHAALRQAQRHPRPALNLLIGIGTFVRRLARLRARPLDDRADPRPGAAGTGRRRPDLARPDGHRRHHRARERGRYQGYIAGVFVASSVAGPVLGGFLAEHLHWSLIFWINLPLGLLAFLMTNGALRRLPRHERPHRLDLLGAVLMVLGDRHAAAGAQLGRSALSLGLSADPRPDPRLGAGWRTVRGRLTTALEPLLPLEVILNPVVAARHRHRLLRHGRADRPRRSTCRSICNRCSVCRPAPPAWRSSP